MDRKQVLSVIVIFALFAFSTAINLSSAASYDHIGVELGDTANYQIKQRSTLGGSIYVYSAAISVEKVEGTHITLRTRESYSNGTVYYDQVVVGDVALGKLIPYLVVANLMEFDPIFSGASARINRTITMTIAGTSRRANCLIMPSTEWVEEYWDQETGLLLIGNYWNPMCCTWRNWTLISTTAFAGGAANGVAAALAPYILAGAMGAVVAVIFIVGVANRGRK